MQYWLPFRDSNPRRMLALPSLTFFPLLHNVNYVLSVLGPCRGHTVVYREFKETSDYITITLPLAETDRCPSPLVDQWSWITHGRLERGEISVPVHIRMGVYSSSFMPKTRIIEKMPRGNYYLMEAFQQLCANSKAWKSHQFTSAQKLRRLFVCEGSKAWKGHMFILD